MILFLQMDAVLYADISQFDVPDGSASCTAAAVLFARQCLNDIPDKDTVHKILYAAANVWKRWKQPGVFYVFQTWKNVVDTFPRIIEGVSIVFETNGHIGNNLPNREYMYSTVQEALNKLKDGRSAIFTSSDSSYGLCAMNGHYYFFDSHGSSRTSGKAYILRIQTLDDLYTFVINNFIMDEEFTMVVFEEEEEPESEGEDR